MTQVLLSGKNWQFASAQTSIKPQLSIGGLALWPKIAILELRFDIQVKSVSICYVLFGHDFDCTENV